MKKIKTYSCGNGDGMFENEDKGLYVEKSDYDKLLDYKKELFDLLYSNCDNLTKDRLYEVSKKYGDL